jgi:L-lactate dehydrogenase (cytochrome)
MKLLEVATLDELGPQHVTQLARLTPIAKPVADAAEAAAASKPTTVRSPRPSSATKSAAASKPAASKPASRNSVTKG